jgi:hypothetical protein
VTLILVSHNNYLVREHCERALPIDHGRIVCDAAADEVLSQYEAQQAGTPETSGEGFDAFAVGSDVGSDTLTEGAFWIDFRLGPPHTGTRMLPVSVYLKNGDGTRVAAFTTSSCEVSDRTTRLTARLPGFAAGTYYVDVKVGSAFHGTHVLHNYPVRIEGPPVTHGCALTLPLHPA